MLTDMHCHLQDKQIFPYLSDVIQKAKKKGINQFLCCGTSESDWQSVLNLHNKYPQIIPAVGIHPWEIKTLSANWTDKFADILTENTECIVGEIGLDLHFCKDTIAEQKDILITQLEIAREFNRPVCIHNLKAWHLLLPIISNFTDIKIMFHSFSCSLEITQHLIKMTNTFFSFSCTILDNQKKSFSEIINIIPDNKLLIETDSPYLLQKNESKNRNYNEPANLIFVLEKIAKIRNISNENLRKQLIINSENFIKDT